MIYYPTENLPQNKNYLLFLRDPKRTNFFVQDFEWMVKLYKKKNPRSKRDFFLGWDVRRKMRVSRGGMRLKARAQAFGHPHYQLVTSKVEIFQDDLLTAKQLTIWQHSKLYLSRTTATIKLVNERTLSVYPFLSTLLWTKLKRKLLNLKKQYCFAYALYCI